MHRGSLRSVPSFAAVLGALALAAAPAAAQPKLLVNTHDAGRYVYGGLHYGGGQWSNVTKAIDRTFTGGVTTVSTLTNLTQMLEYDALWVDQRWRATAATVEIENLLAYAATGRRVVVMGENATWGGWNGQVLGALGGIEGPLDGFPGGAGCLHGRIVSVRPHELTQGVRAIGTACGGYAIGGTQLFAYNIATLWRDAQNVLTILDGNIFDDLFATYDAVTFRDRILGWLAADTRPVVESTGTQGLRLASTDAFGASLDLADPSRVLVNPEPSTVVLLGVGLALVAGVGARRVRRS